MTLGIRVCPDDYPIKDGFDQAEFAKYYQELYDKEYKEKVENPNGSINWENLLELIGLVDFAADRADMVLAEATGHATGKFYLHMDDIRRIIRDHVKESRDQDLKMMVDDLHGGDYETLPQPVKDILEYFGVKEG